MRTVAPAFPREDGGSYPFERIFWGVRRGVMPLIGIALVDLLFHGSDWLPMHGFADEVNHSLTGLVWITAVAVLGVRVVVPAALLGAVAIDLDHVPEILGWTESPPGTSRTYTHSLLLVLALVVIAVCDRRRRVIWGSAALGLLSHLVRDMGTGTVLFWWPLSNRPVGIPYELYFGVTCGLGLAVFFLGIVTRRGGEVPETP